MGWFLLVLTALSLCAGSISGVVVDQNGAVIPAALVVVTAENGEKREAMCNETGRFVIGELATGGYSLKVLPPASSTRESTVFKCFAKG